MNNAGKEVRKEKVNFNVKIKRKHGKKLASQAGWHIAAVRLVQGERW